MLRDTKVQLELVTVKSGGSAVHSSPTISDYNWKNPEGQRDGYACTFLDMDGTFNNTTVLTIDQATEAHATHVRYISTVRFIFDFPWTPAAACKGYCTH